VSIVSLHKKFANDKAPAKERDKVLDYGRVRI